MGRISIQLNHGQFLRELKLAGPLNNVRGAQGEDILGEINGSLWLAFDALNGQ